MDEVRAAIHAECVKEIARLREEYTAKANEYSALSCRYYDLEKRCLAAERALTRITKHCEDVLSAEAGSASK